MLVIGPKVRGFRPCWRQWIFSDVKIRSTTSFRGEVKLSVPCHKILWHIRDPYSMKRDTCRLKSRTFLAKFLPALVLGVCFSLPESSGRWMIRTQMETHNRPIMVAVYGMPWVIPTCNSNILQPLAWCLTLWLWWTRALFAILGHYTPLWRGPGVGFWRVMWTYNYSVYVVHDLFLKLFIYE
jgi:hypothetical protein